LTLSDFKSELFATVRNLIRNNNTNHPWLGLGDEQLLKIAGLYGKDPISNLEGYNLAAVLLFGKDETIVNVLSHFKIDAMVRKNDLFRYDDRSYIQTNLIEAYDQLNSFVEKHLPDKFYLQGDQRISLRSHIFREVIANLIVHREYIDAHPSTFIIYKDYVEIINANNPHGNGLLLPDHFVPFPKNPLIAKFFIQLGRVDELGSGILNVYRYLKDYSPGREPQFIEDKLFKTIIPIGEILYETDDTIKEVTDDAINDAINIQVQNRLVDEIRLIYEKNGLTLRNLMTAFDIKRATGQRDMKTLKEMGYVLFIGSNKSGKYMLTRKGETLFDKFP
jgi:ATP-dependent DNA helicase RecG